MDCDVQKSNQLHVILKNRSHFLSETMAEVKGTYKAFTKFYAKLTKALPMDDLLDEFYANRLLPDDHKAKIESLRTRKEKAQYFLDEIIKRGLSIGYTKQFNEMINVMESSNDPVLKNLSKQIQEYAFSISPNSSDDNGKYFNVFIAKCPIVGLLLCCLVETEVCVWACQF